MKARILSGMVVVCFMIAGEVQARVTTLAGGVSTGYEDYTRNYDIERPPSSNDDYSRIFIAPSISIVTESTRDTLEVGYTPSFRFDLDDSDRNKVDNRFILGYERMLTERWEVTAAESFSQLNDANSYAPVRDQDTGSIISDIPGEDPASGESIRDDQGVRRYTLNSLSFGTRYDYQEESYFSFDYIWSALRNDENDETFNNYQDYDKHNFLAGLGYLINTNWFTSASLGYVIGDYEEDELTRTFFDTSDDLDEYHAGLRGEYRLSAIESYSAAYKYSRADYDSPLRLDNEIHDITFGWARAFSPMTSFSIGAGPTYTKLVGISGDWSLNGNLALNRKFEKGSYNLAAATGSQLDNFRGTDRRGTVDFRQVQADVNYRALEYLNLRAYFTYRQEEKDELVAVDTDSGGEGFVSELVLRPVTTDRYALGCSLDYRLSENYVLDFRYVYTLYNSDLPEDEYDSHKFIATLRYENDFFRW